MDMKIKDAEGAVVRTLKYNGCDKRFSGRSAEIEHVDYANAYEFLGRWDMLDESGNEVPAGIYTAFTQFSILYDPILTVDFEIKQNPVIRRE